jgi:hypothetical protein
LARIEAGRGSQSSWGVRYEAQGQLISMAD